MAFLRFVSTFAVAGALLAIVAVSFAAPMYFGWDNTPAFGKALCDCADTTRQTAERLVHAQLLGGAVGAVLGAIAGTAVGLRRRKSAPPAAAKV